MVRTSAEQPKRTPKLTNRPRARPVGHGRSWQLHHAHQQRPRAVASLPSPTPTPPSPQLPFHLPRLPRRCHPHRLLRLRHHRLRYLRLRHPTIVVTSPTFTAAGSSLAAALAISLFASSPPPSPLPPLPTQPTPPLPAPSSPPPSLLPLLHRLCPHRSDTGELRGRPTRYRQYTPVEKLLPFFRSAGRSRRAVIPCLTPRRVDLRRHARRAKI